MTTTAKTRIRLFGSYAVYQGESHTPLHISGPTEQLLQYLLVYANQEWRREYLAELFWTNSPLARQRSALNSAVCRIRKRLDAIAGLSLHSSANNIELTIADTVAVDVRDYDATLHRACAADTLDRSTVRQLQQQLDETQQPFMDGVGDDWVLPERERIFNLQLRGLALLMHWLGEHGEYEEALEVGRRLLTMDPARETAQCAVMWLYVLNGQRAQALRQYDCFQRWLDSELAIAPMPETRALRDFIHSGITHSETVSESGKSGDNSVWSENLSALELMLSAVDQSRRSVLAVLHNPLA